MHGCAKRSALGGATATFSFAGGIQAFGGFFTDTQDTFPGNVTITFNDGSAQLLNLVKNDNTGGILFFGFTDLGKLITSVAINTGATGGTRDIWGLDDVIFVPAADVPEPGTLGLLGLALAGLAVGTSRRRRS